ncbi:MAG TPA: hypothetical protein VKC58_05470 [Myxococcales bacterium]|jgi:hypothetical protein|nr:hypothetical protein [Myxococcales bacterium]
MKKLIWIGAAVAGLLGAGAAGACDEQHQTAQQQEQKPQKKVAAKKAAKKAAAKPTVAQNDKH